MLPLHLFMPLTLSTGICEYEDINLQLQNHLFYQRG